MVVEYCRDVKRAFGDMRGVGVRGVQRWAGLYGRIALLAAAGKSGGQVLLVGLRQAPSARFSQLWRRCASTRAKRQTIAQPDSGRIDSEQRDCIPVRLSVPCCY